MLKDGNDTFTYDANGNLIKKEAPEGVINYSYDFQDDLIKVEDSNGNITEYKYDGEQNRIATIYNGTTTNYVLDRNSQLTWVLAETDENGEITKYYLYGLGLTSQISPDSKVLYYHYDNIGNTIALTDKDGNVTDEYSYEAFGKIASQTGTTENPFKYVGRYGVMEEKNELMFMRMRYYDSATGRFFKPDPLKNLTGYVYVGNNPLVFIDPLGLWTIGIGGEITKYLGIGGDIEISQRGIYIKGKGNIGLALKLPILPYISSGTPEPGLATEVESSAIVGYTVTFRVQEGEVVPSSSWGIGPRVGVSGGESYTKEVLKWTDAWEFLKMLIKGKSTKPDQATW